jgi:hypothetical protein
MSKIDEREVVAGVKLRKDKPTNVALDKLYGWVIWQFPHAQKSGYQGAVRPPIADHEWIPAVIRADKKRVRVYGNAGRTFPTPEEAVAYFQEK